ncbi:MAG TPA: NADH-quinone oxidoreductase subunit H, partial [Steroidobacteraceae bacterium]|nr:NADH-quinone oxidoreductase subunit H [Steroidobacteraceae bacterium]
MLERLHTLWASLPSLWAALPDYVRTTVWILIVTVALILSVAFLTLWERKVIGWMQLRRGPNRVRVFGLLPGIGQPFADVLKLLIK